MYKIVPSFLGKASSFVRPSRRASNNFMDAERLERGHKDESEGGVQESSDRPIRAPPPRKAGSVASVQSEAASMKTFVSAR